MHAKYVTTTGVTQAQVINDLALLISGSPLSALSAGCDKVNSTLVSTVAPGWSIVDAVAPGSGCVLSAPDADGLTTKLVRLFALSATVLDLLSYESWNSVAHTGTNVCTSVNTLVGANFLPTFTAGTVNTYWVFATPRMLFICSGLYGSAGSTAGVGAFEFTRSCEYLKGTTYPCFGIAYMTGVVGSIGGLDNTQIAMHLSRVKNLGAVGDFTGTSAKAAPGCVTGKGYHAGGLGIGGPTDPLFDANNALYHEVRELYVLALQRTIDDQPILGKLYDVVEITRNAGSTFDTVKIDTDTYMLFRATNNTGSRMTAALKIA